MYLFGTKTMFPKELDMETKAVVDKTQNVADIAESMGIEQDAYNIDEGYFLGCMPVMYWRKANAIHDWFVRNVQDNVDNCGYYWLSSDTLQELLNEIKQVLETKVTDALKPTAGFFFGSQEIDEYYWQDLQDTYDKLTPIVSKYDGFMYSSSW